MTIQYRVAVTKKEELVDGPADAAVVVTTTLADCALEPSVAYMRGRLKSTGPTGPLLDALRRGTAAEALAGLVGRYVADR